MQAATLQLDDEQQARVIDCLRKAGVKLAPEVESKLMRDIGHSIQVWLATRAVPSMTPRQLHDALRGIWLLADEDDCPVGQLRSRTRELPQQAIGYLCKRAHRLFPSLFPEGSGETGFLEWVRSASAEDLISTVRVLSAEGGRLVSRSRGGGKRSRASLEPRVLGQVRGAGDGRQKGGRPEHGPQQDLIRSLAVDWIIATGKAPEPGRSDYRGFGDLVHSVFQWLEESSPDQALRRYWQDVAEAQAITVRRAGTHPS